MPTKLISWIEPPKLTIASRGSAANQYERLVNRVQHNQKSVNLSPIPYFNSKFIHTLGYDPGGRTGTRDIIDLIILKDLPPKNLSLYV